MIHKDRQIALASKRVQIAKVFFEPHGKICCAYLFVKIVKMADIVILTESVCIIKMI